MQEALQFAGASQGGTMLLEVILLKVVQTDSPKLLVPFPLPQEW